MHLQRMAGRRNRGADQARTGTILDDPPIDFSAMARSMGVWAQGPVSDPDELAPTLGRALEVVKTGRPALVDVLTQPR